VLNGLLFRQEFHTLFDNGGVTVTPELHVRVGRHIEREWNNGTRDSAYDGAHSDRREQALRSMNGSLV